MIYLASGQDSSSDNGYFEILIDCKIKATAIIVAKNFLKEINRKDLIPNLEVKEFVNIYPCVLYDTVERQ